MNKLGISVIVKDEIRCIRRLLDSIKYSNADYICILDTGSTDGTLEVLRQFESLYPNIHVHTAEWIDFSTMRNLTFDILQNAGINWVLTLDADEWFEDPEEVFVELYRILEIAGDEVDTINMVVKNYLTENQAIAASYDIQNRLVHLRPEIRWVGSIHNQIAESINKNPRNGKQAQAAETNLVIHHDGYSLPKEKKVAKFTPRLDLNKDEAIKHEDPIKSQYYWYQYIKTLYTLNMEDEIDEVVNNHLDITHLRNRLKLDICGLLTALYSRRGDLEKTDYFSKMALETNSEEPLALLSRAYHEFSAGNFDKAYPFFIAGMIMSASNPNRRNDLNIDYIAYMLMLCLKNMGVPAEALLYGLVAEKHLPFKKAIRQELRELVKSINLTIQEDEFDNPVILIEVNDD